MANKIGQRTNLDTNATALVASAMGAELNPESRVGKNRVDDASGRLWARLGKAEEELQVHRE